MSDEQVVKLLEEIRDLQKESLANQKVSLQNQQVSLQNQQASRQNLQESIARQKKALQTNKIVYTVLIVFALYCLTMLFAPFLLGLLHSAIRR